MNSSLKSAFAPCSSFWLISGGWDMTLCNHATNLKDPVRGFNQSNIWIPKAMINEVTGRTEAKWRLTNLIRNLRPTGIVRAKLTAGNRGVQLHDEKLLRFYVDAKAFVVFAPVGKIRIIDFLQLFHQWQIVKFITQFQETLRGIKWCALRGNKVTSGVDGKQRGIETKVSAPQSKYLFRVASFTHSMLLPASDLPADP